MIYIWGTCPAVYLRTIPGAIAHDCLPGHYLTKGEALPFCQLLFPAIHSRA